MYVELRFSVTLEEGLWKDLWEWGEHDPSDEKIIEEIVLDEMVDLMAQPSARWQVVRDGAVGHPLRLRIAAGMPVGVERVSVAVKE